MKATKRNGERKHFKMSVHLPEEQTIEILINKPIVTVEYWIKEDPEQPYLISYGMSYCRPNDMWSWVKGLNLATSAMILRCGYPIDFVMINKHLEFLYKRFSQWDASNQEEAIHWQLRKLLNELGTQK